MSARYELRRLRQPQSWAVIAGTIIVGITGLITWQIWQGDQSETSNAPTALKTDVPTVTALGRLEPRWQQRLIQKQ
jgi:predicted negative regulator of RcsB-dependent stress response